MSVPAGVTVHTSPALELCRWLQSTPLSVLIRGSSWAFAAIEMVHLLGLALLGSAVLIVALRTADLTLTVQPLAVVARGLLPAGLTGLAVLVVSGALLAADEPLRYYSNAALRTKLTLLAAALAASVLAYRRAAAAQSGHGVSVALRAAIVLAALLWLAVALAGRLIGVL